MLDMGLLNTEKAKIIDIVIEGPFRQLGGGDSFFECLVLVKIFNMQYVRAIVTAFYKEEINP